MTVIFPFHSHWDNCRWSFRQKGHNIVPSACNENLLVRFLDDGFNSSVDSVVENIVNITGKETSAQVGCKLSFFRGRPSKMCCKNAVKSTSHRQLFYLLKLLVIESKAPVRKDRLQYHTDMLSRYVVVLKLVF